MSLTENAEPDKYEYSGYRILLDVRSQLSLFGGNWAKNIIIFGVDNSSSVHVNNKKKKMLVLGKGPTQGLDDATTTTEAKCSINFTETRKRFVLTLHYNGSNSLLFDNATKIYQFKGKYSAIKPYTLFLGNIS